MTANMNPDERDEKFRLEDEPEGGKAKSKDWWSVPSGDEEVAEGIDHRTVSERRGTAVEIVAGRRPPPPGWPQEALSFPLRASGPRIIIVLALLLCGFDLAERANMLLGLLLKLSLLPVVLRWQLHTASMTAAGQDRPPLWMSAMDFRGEHVRGVAMLIVLAAITLVPGLLVIRYAGLGLGLALLGAAGVWLAAGALGQAVGQPALIRPWNAVAWFGRHPLGLLVTTVGWWAAGLAEWGVGTLAEQPVGGALALGFGMRIVGVYLLFVSARVLGVVGRSWSAWAEPS